VGNRRARYVNITLSFVLLALLLPSCSARWDRVVRYTPESADHPVLVEMYRAVLADVVASDDPRFVALQGSADSPLLAKASGDESSVPQHWEDSLRREVRVALAGRSEVADTVAVTQAAGALGLTVLPPDTTAWPESSGHAPPPRVRLSGAGFNEDSTIAAVEVEYWCGPLCGSGRTLLLARHPGTRWRVWYSVMHWIS
jgi:hypothetical protein